MTHTFATARPEFDALVASGSYREAMRRAGDAACDQAASPQLREWCAGYADALHAVLASLESKENRDE